MRRNLANALHLMLVTDDTLVSPSELPPRLLAAVAGGVTAVQLRLKRAGAREQARLGRLLVAELPVPVLLNDRPDVAAAAGAAGVHLGPDDVPPSVARAVLGAGAIVGASVGTVAEAERLARDPGRVDYWGIGPWRATGTKADAGGALGGAGVARLLARAAGRPCIVIGGVRPADLGAIRGLGAAGVAVVSGILAADDPAAAARAYRAAWAEAG